MSTAEHNESQSTMSHTMVTDTDRKGGRRQ